jgi:hypothetical protein
MKEPKRIKFDGADLTYTEIARRMRVSENTARRYCRGADAPQNAEQFAARRRAERIAQHAGTRRGGKAAAYSSLMPGEFRT